MSYVSISLITVYVIGLIIGSWFGVFAGFMSLLALIFATKFFKYSRNNDEEPAPSQISVQ